MGSTRRTFLRVLGSALIGAVVAPALPTRPPITYALLERAYHEALDSGEPPRWVVARLELLERRWTLARDTGLVYDVELAA